MLSREKLAPSTFRQFLSRASILMCVQTKKVGPSHNGAIVFKSMMSHWKFYSFGKGIYKGFQTQNIVFWPTKLFRFWHSQNVLIGTFFLLFWNFYHWVIWTPFIFFHGPIIGKTALLQILLGRGIHIDFSSQLKFAKIEFYGAFHL